MAQLWSNTATDAMENTDELEGLAPEDREILVAATTKLTEATGLKTGLRVGHWQEIDKNYRYIIIDIINGENKFPYIVEFQKVDRAEALIGVRNRKVQTPNPYETILVTPRLTTKLAEDAKALGLQFIDTAGNAFLKAPGLFVFVTGQTAALPNKYRTKAGGNPTAIRVMFVLLCRPELAEAPLREIAKAAGVALGGVGAVMQELRTRGFLPNAEQRTNRRLRDIDRMLEEWVLQYPITLRNKLNPRRFKAPDHDWWKNVDLTQVGGLWGGEVAADRYTNYLRPATTTIYIDTKKGMMPQLIIQNRLRPDPHGNVEILAKFWDLPDNPKFVDVVPPILAYADLRNTLDPRNIEVAKLLYEQRIANADTDAET